jgi:S-adenosylmethionine:tRNA ribosyltransferase-isomerase
VRTSDFDYHLPPELIAQLPAEPRDSARLFVLERASGAYAHRCVRDLPELLRPGDLLVVNRSRVLPARVRGHLRGGGQAELLLLRRLGPARWQALGRPARRLRSGDTVEIADGLRAHVVATHPEGVRDVAVDAPADQDADAALLAAGSVPLPPYIRAWTGDPERYQTVYAEVDGSAAAPTAGLHLTPELLARLQAAGVGLARLVLHIGLDTFRPVSGEDPTRHSIHQEWYVIPEETQRQVQAAQRVVAVGTTTVRALESWAASGRTQGWTDLFILPGFQFRVVQGLLTNFHLPRSTLLMLVSALSGRERILAAYAEAVRAGYRFYSFGDAMLLL